MSDLGLFETLVSPEIANDPYPFFAALREQGPVITLQPGLMIATSYAAVDASLRDPLLGVQQGSEQSILGTNPPDHTRMRRLVSGAFAPRRKFRLSPEDEAACLSADELLRAYFKDLVRLRRGTPQNDLSNLIGNGVMALFQHPDQMQRLAEKPELATLFVEEFLRYDAPVQLTTRIALETTVLSGQPVDQGTYVVALKHLPGLALSGEPVRRNRLVLRGYESLPVSWS